jgi:hypothetical protein
MPLELTKIAADTLSPAVARAVGAPGPAKMMAARGLVPMGPNDLVTVLYQLSLDDEAKIAEAAKGTAQGLPENILGAALGDQKLDPRVLDYFARIVVKHSSLVELMLLNRAVHDDTLVFFGKKAAERELEILAGNQERILEHPEIIEAIYFNSAARMSTVKRLLELAVRHGITLDVPQFKEIAHSIMGEQEELEKLPAEARADAEQMKALDDDIMDEAFSEALAMGDDSVGALEFEEKEDEEKHIRLLDRPFLEKIRLASCGKLFHRMVLIKDSNKTVAMAVIQSAGVTDQEASRYAGNRSLHEDIIRYIAARKDWQKNYQVKLSLVNNPKCPLASSMRLLKHLRANDIRTLSRSKNVPAALAQAAKQIVNKRR